MTSRPLLSSFQVKPLIAAKTMGTESARSSTNLNRSVEEVHLLPEGVRFPEDVFVSWEVLHEIAGEEKRVFDVSDGGCRAVQIFSESTGWVRTLCATSAGPPTTLISGIPMHRIKDTDPMKDTSAKLVAFGKITGPVLDTATGLGYTAIEAAKHSIAVTTIELDPAAIDLARENPWSAQLFFSHRIKQVVGDAFEEIQAFGSGHFAGVIHDPPTMSLGGELYSQEFYNRMFRVLKRGGRLFHYVGDPSSGVGKKAYPGIMKRLSLAGFKHVRVEEDAYGLSAIT